MASTIEPSSILSPTTLRTSGALLSAQTSLARAIVCAAVSPTGHDQTTIDLLVRLDQAPDNRLRAIELSRQLLLSPSHVSRMIDRAENSGLVKREPDRDDRRATQISLTDQGREILTEFAPRFEAVIDRAIHHTLSPTEADTLVELLGRIEKAAHAANPVEGP